MYKRGRIAKLVTSTALAAIMAGLPAVQALACTQVTIGNQLTSDGDTYFGRSEDYSNRYGKVFGIEPATDNGKVIQSHENDGDHADSFRYEITGPTFRYTYVRDTPDNWTSQGDPGAKAYSEAGTNEKGVSLSSTLTTNMNAAVADADPLVKTGIGEYSIADFVLSQATTARKGVELLGQVIDQQGSQDCNQIVIGDANETWIFMQLSGHQWCAVKCASNLVSINPNMSNLQFDVDLEDPSVCLHSANMAQTAQTAHTYVETNGRMNVAASYGKTSVEQGYGQNIRYVQGHKYFGDANLGGYTLVAGKGVKSIDNNQLFFSPTNASIDTFTALRVFACRGEGTDVDANANAGFYAIGSNRNTESHVFQVRDEYATSDPEVATIQWEGLSRSEFTVFVPSYSNLLTNVDTELYPSEAHFSVGHVGIQDEGGDAGKIAQNEQTAMADGGQVNLDYVLMDINTLAYNHRDTVATGAHAYLDALQKEIIEEQKTVDSYVVAAQGTEARTALANRAHAVVSRGTFKKTHKLLEEIRAYLSAGNFSQPFAASDLTADGKLAEPLGYADAFTLTIDRQPASATAFQNEGTPALTVSAKSGSSDNLSYKWQKSTDESNWSDCGSSDTYAPQTADLGTTFYRVIVSDDNGNSVISESAKIEVVEKPVKQKTGSMYRLYNPYTSEHFYTANFDEMIMNVGLGWKYEGVGWEAPEHSNTPVYRLYNPYTSDHHYTVSPAERDSLVAAGWNDEGIGWYSDDEQGVPLYRQYNPYARTGAHNYTASGYERDSLVKAGWRDEGVGWYGVAEED